MWKILLVLMLIWGCKTTQPLITTENKIQNDSLHTEAITVRDSIIYLPGDSIPYNIPCDLDTTFILNSNLGQLLIVVKDGKVYGTSTVKEKTLVVPKTEIIRNTTSSQKKDSVITVTKEVKVPTYITKYPKFLVISTSLFYIILLILGIRLYLKTKLGFIKKL